MLVRTRERVARSAINLIRELFLILAVGAIGGQMLIALNGGQPIGGEALAAANLSDQPVPRIASLELDLDPRNPTMVRSVFLELVVAENVASEQLRILPTSASREQYECHVETSATWHCITPGLLVAELEKVILLTRKQ